MVAAALGRERSWGLSRRSAHGGFPQAHAPRGEGLRRHRYGRLPRPARTREDRDDAHGRSVARRDEGMSVMLECGQSLRRATSVRPEPCRRDERNGAGAVHGSTALRALTTNGAGGVAGALSLAAVRPEPATQWPSRRRGLE